MPKMTWPREVAVGMGFSDQNSASNGQTSMQMPHHMHWPKSMVKVSKTFFID
jgi:hypothetical protein